MAELKHEITERLGVIKEKKGGWNKELNLVSWAGKSPKYDIRDWSDDHTKMSKGVTLTEEELLNLYELIGELFFNDDEKDAESDNHETLSPVEQSISKETGESEYIESEGSQGKHDYGKAFLDEITKLESEL